MRHSLVTAVDDAVQITHDSVVGLNQGARVAGDAING
jgi:hypothetical protein